MEKISYKINSTKLQIYIDGILHVRIPVNNNTFIYSYIEEETKTFNIKIKINNNTILLMYESKDIWIKILNILNNL